MLLSIPALLAGLILLVWGAERLVEGAAALAQRAGWSPLLVGLVVVGFGSSASELAVAVTAALQDHPALALVRLEMGESGESGAGDVCITAPVLARLTRRSVHALSLQPGASVWVQIKAVALLG